MTSPAPEVIVQLLEPVHCAMNVNDNVPVGHELFASWLVSYRCSVCSSETIPLCTSCASLLENPAQRLETDCGAPMECGPDLVLSRTPI